MFFGHFWGFPENGRFWPFWQIWHFWPILGIFGKIRVFAHFRTPEIPGPRRGCIPTIDPDHRSCHNPDMSIHGFDIMNDATPPGPRRKFAYPPCPNFRSGTSVKHHRVDDASAMVSMTRRREWSHESFSCCQRDHIEDTQKRCRSFELIRRSGPGRPPKSSATVTITPNL